MKGVSRACERPLSDQTKVAPRGRWVRGENYNTRPVRKVRVRASFCASFCLDRSPRFQVGSHRFEGLVPFVTILV